MARAQLPSTPRYVPAGDLGPELDIGDKTRKLVDTFVERGHGLFPRVGTPDLKAAIFQRFLHSLEDLDFIIDEKDEHGWLYLAAPAKAEITVDATPLIRTPT